MSITTKTGDHGETSLYTGERVKKSSLRVRTYGTVDEMTSAFALARAFCEKKEVKEKIFDLQKKAQLLMADFASINREPLVTNEIVTRLEEEMASLEKSLPPLDHFIIPGDTKGGAALDLARSTARRAEREGLLLGEEEEVHQEDIIFLNRISDYAFLLMRLEQAQAPGA